MKFTQLFTAIVLGGAALGGGIRCGDTTSSGNPGGGGTTTNPGGGGTTTDPGDGGNPRDTGGGGTHGW